MFAICPRLRLTDGSGGHERGLWQTQRRPPRPPSVTKVPALHPGAGLPAAQVQGIPGERPSRKMNGWPQAAELVTIELTRTLPVWLSDRIYGKMNDELQSTDLKRDLWKPVC